MARVPARSGSGSGFGAGNGFASAFSGGGRFPPIIGVLIAATIVSSIIGIIGMRHGFPLLAYASLVPSRIVHGEVWRLFTWVFFETSPMGLLFACLSLFWFSRDLALRWGPTRFVVMYLGIAVLTGAVVCLVARVYSPLWDQVIVGAMPVQDALIILWASYYPTRQILMFFALPMSGRRIIWFTLGITALLAIFDGIDAFIPNFVAELLALASVSLPSPRSLWIEARLRGMEKKRAATHLRSVPREPSPGDHGRDDDKPPSGRWLN